MRPQSSDPDTLMWPGRNPWSHVVTFGRVFDVTSYRRKHLKPRLHSLILDGMRFHDPCHTFASLMLAAVPAERGESMDGLCQPRHNGQHLRPPVPERLLGASGSVRSLRCQGIGARPANLA